MTGYINSVCTAVPSVILQRGGTTGETVLREMPYANSRPVADLTAGTTVNVAFEVRNAAGQRWCFVTAGEQKGYVSGLQVFLK